MSLLETSCARTHTQTRDAMHFTALHSSLHSETKKKNKAQSSLAVLRDDYSDRTISDEVHR